MKRSHIIEYLEIMEQSEKWKLNSEDVKKWLKNSLTFFAPVFLIYLSFVSEKLSGGFTWSVFIPSNSVVSMMVLYGVNVLIDLFKKLSVGK